MQRRKKLLNNVVSENVVKVNFLLKVKGNDNLLIIDLLIVVSVRIRGTILRKFMANRVIVFSGKITKSPGMYYTVRLEISIYSFEI